LRGRSGDLAWKQVQLRPGHPIWPGLFMWVVYLSLTSQSSLPGIAVVSAGYLEEPTLANLVPDFRPSHICPLAKAFI
jgi:hypothetical protein